MTKPQKDESHGKDELENVRKDELEDVTGGIGPSAMAMPGVTNAGLYVSSAASVVGSGANLTASIMSSKSNLEAIEKNGQIQKDLITLQADSEIRIMEAQAKLQRGEL